MLRQPQKVNGADSNKGVKSSRKYRGEYCTRTLRQLEYLSNCPEFFKTTELLSRFQICNDPSAPDHHISLDEWIELKESGPTRIFAVDTTPP